MHVHYYLINIIYRWSLVSSKDLHAVQET